MATMADFPTGEEDLPLPCFAEVFGDGTEETILVPNNPVFARRRLASRKAGSRAPGEESAGRWTPEEQKLFLDGLMMYGKDWKRMAPLIKTRSLVQIRTHAQKVFKKLGMKLTEDRNRVAGQKRSLDDMHEDYIDEAQLNKLRASGHLEGLVASGDIHIGDGMGPGAAMMPLHHNAALVAAAAAAMGVPAMAPVVVGAMPQQQAAAVAAAAAVAMHQQQQAAFAAALMSAGAAGVQSMVAPQPPVVAAQPPMMNFSLTNEEAAFLQQHQQQLLQQYQQVQAQQQAQEQQHLHNLHQQQQQQQQVQQQLQMNQMGYMTGPM